MALSPEEEIIYSNRVGGGPTVTASLTEAEADALFLTLAEGDTAFLTAAEGDTLFLTQAEGDTRYVNEADAVALIEANSLSQAEGDTRYVNESDAVALIETNSLSQAEGDTRYVNESDAVALIAANSLDQTEGDARYVRPGETNTFTVAQTIAGGSTATDRLVLGADTALYRGAADVVKTDDTFAFVGGLKWDAAALVQTTVGVAGGASLLPISPTKYLKVIDDAGTTLVVPAFLAS